MRDVPIGAAHVFYLDSAAEHVSWLATSSGPTAVYGCDFEPRTQLLFQQPPIQIELGGEAECCDLCWKEALCSAAEYDADTSVCRIGVGRLEPRAAPRSNKTACTARRSTSSPPISMVATVPGDLISDLFRAKLIGEPLFGLNFQSDALWTLPTWTYTTTFTLPPASSSAVESGGSLTLVFEGIKMGAVVALNGHVLGTATDQFLRYEFDATKATRASGEQQVSVTFDPAISVDGRFMACSGGWDWAPYSLSTLNGTRYFSKGIWKSVYVAVTPPAAAEIRHVSPLIRYAGAYPTSRLVDGEHAGFNLRVRAFLWASQPTSGRLTVQPSWCSGCSVTSRRVSLPLGGCNVSLAMHVAAADVRLWWPAGLGQQNLYPLKLSFQPYPLAVASRSAAQPPAVVSTTRRIGFRHFALVTGNDTNASWVRAAEGREGSGDHGLYFRVNGVAIYSRGANLVPMDELEGRLTAAAYAQLVASSVAAHFNTLRVWGGGIFAPDTFYNACDEMGLLVYHDMQYAQSGHSPRATPTQEAELRHQVRRLSTHPSIVIYDGCNECRVDMAKPTSIYATFVMSIVAEEDDSRAVWPSCPSVGWSTGTRTLDSTPVEGGTLATPSAERRTIEVHGPYLRGSGFPSVNGYDTTLKIDCGLPLVVTPAPTGISRRSVFASEFGAAVMPSFESLAPTLAPQHWGLHAGQPNDVCTPGFSRKCVGDNVMAQRNYPCDALILAYFGPLHDDGFFNATGELVFKRQLYLCSLAQALYMKVDIEARRGRNELGHLVWQLNEVWPTGGWGSIEYGTPIAGQVLGGRWKPLHYWYKRLLFADTMVACGFDESGATGMCFVRHDGPGPLEGIARVDALDLTTGTRSNLVNHPLILGAGPGATAFWKLAALGDLERSTSVLLASVLAQDERVTAEVQIRGLNFVSYNEILLARPYELRLPASVVSASVASLPNQDGSVDITVGCSNASALFVTLTTKAAGHFSDNSFAVTFGPTLLRFFPFGELDLSLLRATLRVEHLRNALRQPTW